MVWAIILSVHRHAFQGAEDISAASDAYSNNMPTSNPSFINNDASQQKVMQHDDETQDL